MPAGIQSANRPHAGDLRAVHAPYCEGAVGVLQQNVSFLVAVVITSCNDRPGVARFGDVSRASDRGAVHGPHGDCAVGLTNEEVVSVVAVEVTGTHQGRAGWDGADQFGVRDLGPVNLPPS